MCCWLHQKGSSSTHILRDRISHLQSVLRSEMRFTIATRLQRSVVALPDLE